MRAALFTDKDTSVEVTDIDLAVPSRNEVRVQIAAAGVCHSELHLVRGEWEAPARPWFQVTKALSDLADGAQLRQLLIP
ncbi:hypothetical protein ACIA5E_03475 [Nocardia asteroides]|uniref:hypothetical protein n=1 Tax=Nocardia asteroides TaxID=1824 RepID=UPI0037AB2625